MHEEYEDVLVWMRRYGSSGRRKGGVVKGKNGVTQESATKKETGAVVENDKVRGTKGQFGCEG